MISGENSTNQGDQTSGNFTISDIRSYEAGGSTNYAMNGVFNETNSVLGINGTIRVVFSQEYITSDQMWLDVVFANVGDVMFLQIQLNSGIYYALSVTVVVAPMIT